MIRRLRPAGISPLEVWDVLTPRGPLYLARGGPPLVDGVVAMVRALAAGEARRSQGAVTLPAVAFDRVVVGGGGDAAVVVGGLGAAGYSASVADGGAFVGVVGGRALCGGDDDALIVDVGQTAIKSLYRGERRRWPRPPELPIGEVDDERLIDHASRQAARGRAVSFIATALRTPQAPSRVIIALPCEVDDNVTAAGCSYPWYDGDDALVVDIVTAAGLADDVDVAIINDAELAACAVADVGVSLVLTVGLGVGAALVSR